MTQVYLDQLDTLSKAQKSSASKANILATADVLLSSTSDLQKRLRLPNLESVNDFVLSVSRGVVPPTRPMDELAEEELEEGCWIGTGDSEIDMALGGGLRLGTITEIAGESAAGKSHLGLQLSLTCQLASCSTAPGGSVVLTSERDLSSSRLLEVAAHLCSTEDDRKPEAMLDNVRTTRCNDVDALDHALSYVLPALLSAPTALPTRLLVLDSIGALMRSGDIQSSSNGLTQRSRQLCLIADKLKALAVNHKIAVLVINQVSDVFTRGQASIPHTQLSASASGWSSPAARAAAGEPLMLYATQAWWFSGVTDDLMKEASLGLVWANAVNVRIMLSRTGRRRIISSTPSKRQRTDGDGHHLPDPTPEASQPTLIRRLHVVFSPFAPPSTTDFIISKSGVHSVPARTRPAVTTQHSEEEYAAGDDVFDDLGELGDEFWNAQPMMPS